MIEQISIVNTETIIALAGFMGGLAGILLTLLYVFAYQQSNKEEQQKKKYLMGLTESERKKYFEHFKD